MRIETNKKQCSFTLSQKHIEILEKIAMEKSLSKSSTLQIIIEDYFNRMQ